MYLLIMIIVQCAFMLIKVEVLQGYMSYRIIWLLFYAFLHIEQNVSPSPNKAFSLWVCVGGHSLSQETSFFIYHHAGCHWGCSNTVPKLPLRMQCGHTAEICSLKIVLSINVACDAQLWLSFCFLEFLSRGWGTEKMSTQRDLFHFLNDAGVLCTGRWRWRWHEAIGKIPKQFKGLC